MYHIRHSQRWTSDFYKMEDQLQLGDAGEYSCVEGGNLFLRSNLRPGGQRGRDCPHRRLMRGAMPGGTVQLIGNDSADPGIGRNEKRPSVHSHSRSNRFSDSICASIPAMKSPSRCTNSPAMAIILTIIFRVTSASAKDSPTLLFAKIYRSRHRSGCEGRRLSGRRLRYRRRRLSRGLDDARPHRARVLIQLGCNGGAAAERPEHETGDRRRTQSILPIWSSSKKNRR